MFGGWPGFLAIGPGCWGGNGLGGVEIKRLGWLGFVLWGTAVLAPCGGEAVPSPTPAPTMVVATAVMEQETVLPTHTAVPATETATLAATAQPTPEPTATGEPTSPPTITPESSPWTTLAGCLRCTAK